MNLNLFFFKLAVILGYVARMTAILLPICLVFVITKEGGWQYGFTFIKNNFNVALFLAFSFGFLITLYHTISFETVGKGPLANYLKTWQIVEVRSDAQLSNVLPKLKESNKYKRIELIDGKIVGLKNVRFFQPDKVEIEQITGGFRIESKPYFRWLFMDFGRNFKNVVGIGKTVTSA